MSQPARPTPIAHGLPDETMWGEYRQAVHRSFLQAAGDASLRLERDYRIAGQVVRLSSPSARVLDTMGAALAHLRVDTQAKPELTVYLWDSMGPGALSRPPAPWRWWTEHGADGATPPVRYDRHGELTEPQSAQLHTAFRLWPHTLRMLDSRQELAFYWTDDIARIPDYEQSAPLREILAWWSSTRGHQMVHAAAVGTEDGGVLLAGKGGSGKSTAALACLGSALKYAGDDCCLLEGGDTPRVASLYSSAKLKTMREVARFRGLESAVHNGVRRAHEKPFMLLHGHRPECLSPGFPVRALLIPHVTGVDPPRLEPVSAAAGLAALVPSTLRLFPGREREATRRMARFVARVPSYRLEVGADLHRIPDTILELLARS